MLTILPHPFPVAFEQVIVLLVGDACVGMEDVGLDTYAAFRRRSPEFLSFPERLIDILLFHFRETF